MISRPPHLLRLRFSDKFHGIQLRQPSLAIIAHDPGHSATLSIPSTDAPTTAAPSASTTVTVTVAVGFRIRIR